MPVYQVHPDNKIILRSSVHGVYIDTPENFQIDAGVPAYLPASEYNDFWYNDDPTKERYAQNNYDPSNRVDLDDMPELNAILDNVGAIIAAQQARLYPPLTLAEKRTAVKGQLKIEMATRAGQRIDALGTIEMIELMAELWPMLNTGAASNDLLYIRECVIAARQAAQVINGLSSSQLDAYDVVTNPGWPV